MRRRLRGRQWATEFSTVLVDARDRVIDTVLRADSSGARPRPAGAESVDLLVARLCERRLTPVEDPEGLWPEGVTEPGVTQYFQIDGCVDSFFLRRRHELEREAEQVAEHHRTLAQASRDRLPINAAMAESLATFQAWFSARTLWKCWFGTSRTKEPHVAAHDVKWDPEYGISVLIGGLSPRFVFALAGPHRDSEKLDKRVAAWTTGKDPAVDTSGFSIIYTPVNVLDVAGIDLSQLKPVPPRRRWQSDHSRATERLPGIIPPD